MKPLALACGGDRGIQAAFGAAFLLGAKLVPALIAVHPLILVEIQSQHP
jgi:hypothetical protein